jgi:hypothetical protein
MIATTDVLLSISSPELPSKEKLKPKCSKCLSTGHNMRTCPTKPASPITNKVDEDTMSIDSQINEMATLSQAVAHVPTAVARTVLKDTYTPEVLKARFALHRTYVQGSIEVSKKYGIKFRYPSIPEDISENLVKFILHKKGDTTSSWNCGGDLLSSIEGKQECKCFTSDGPPSFTPSSEWDVIYFLDARFWLDNRFKLFKVDLKRTSDEWKNIKVSKKQSFDDQCKQGRRPRITWDSLYPQISQFCTEVYSGDFEGIFTQPATVQASLQ